MKQFFVSPPTPSTLDPISMCNYCGEPCVERGRFRLPKPSNPKGVGEGLGNFCTPECVAAYNAYRCPANTEEERTTRHALLERIHCRRIVPAPPPSVLGNATTALPRAQWLAHCRSALCLEDKRAAEAETALAIGHRYQRKD
jgi:hypothetical protein